MATELKNKVFKDVDGARLWVQSGGSNGGVMFDTDPDSYGVDSMIYLSEAQVAELVRFISR